MTFAPKMAPITIQVRDTALKALEARAKSMGYPVSKYAQMLFEAGYMARVGREKDIETGDGELDRQVALVFAFADAKPAAIARATGMPAERCERILEAWREVASSPRGPVCSAPRAVPALPGAPETGSNAPAPAARHNAWPPEIRDAVVKRYAAGEPVRDIAAAVGKSKAAVDTWVSAHRELCPHRRKGYAK